MRHFTFASVLLLASGKLGFAVTHDVIVGGNSTVFTPSSVVASPGDVVRFTFMQKNHTVTQSTLGNPCLAMQDGFDSGFVFVAADKKTDFPIAELHVNDTNPIWAYCRQGTHCSQSAMVFAVNPGTKFAAFQAAATSPPLPSATSTSAPAPTSSTSTGTDHKVIVGGVGTLAFTPSNIIAQVGDTVTFEFHEKNHTVTASSFASPCTPAGFDSGFKPVSSDVTNFPTYTITVNNTTPIWAYCKQATHCNSGMVFAVNTNESSTKTFAAFQANARSATPGSSGSSGSTGYGSSSATGRPSSSMAVVLGLFAAAFLL